MGRSSSRSSSSRSSGRLTTPRQPTPYAQLSPETRAKVSPEIRQALESGGGGASSVYEQRGYIYSPERGGYILPSTPEELAQIKITPVTQEVQQAILQRDVLREAGVDTSKLDITTETGRAEISALRTSLAKQKPKPAERPSAPRETGIDVTVRPSTTRERITEGAKQYAELVKQTGLRLSERGVQYVSETPTVRTFQALRERGVGAALERGFEKERERVETKKLFTSELETIQRQQEAAYGVAVRKAGKVSYQSRIYEEQRANVEKTIKDFNESVSASIGEGGEISEESYARLTAQGEALQPQIAKVEARGKELGRLGVSLEQLNVNLRRLGASQAGYTSGLAVLEKQTPVPTFFGIRLPQEVGVLEEGIATVTTKRLLPARGKTEELIKIERQRKESATRILALEQRERLGLSGLGVVGALGVLKTGQAIENYLSGFGERTFLRIRQQPLTTTAEVVTGYGVGKLFGFTKTFAARSTVTAGAYPYVAKGVTVAAVGFGGYKIGKEVVLTPRGLRAKKLGELTADILPSAVAFGAGTRAGERAFAQRVVGGEPYTTQRTILYEQKILPGQEKAFFRSTLEVRQVSGVRGQYAYVLGKYRLLAPEQRFEIAQQIVQRGRISPITQRESEYFGRAFPYKEFGLETAKPTIQIQVRGAVTKTTVKAFEQGKLLSKVVSKERAPFRAFGVGTKKETFFIREATRAERLDLGQAEFQVARYLGEQPRVGLLKRPVSLIFGKTKFTGRQAAVTGLKYNYPALVGQPVLVRTRFLTELGLEPTKVSFVEVAGSKALVPSSQYRTFFPSFKRGVPRVPKAKEIFKYKPDVSETEVMQSVRAFFASQKGQVALTRQLAGQGRVEIVPVAEEVLTPRAFVPSIRPVPIAEVAPTRAVVTPVTLTSVLAITTARQRVAQKEVTRQRAVQLLRPLEISLVRPVSRFETVTRTITREREVTQVRPVSVTRELSIAREIARETPLTETALVPIVEFQLKGVPRFRGGFRGRDIEKLVPFKLPQLKQRELQGIGGARLRFGKLPRRYVANYVAVALGIVGKKPKGVVTGFTLRPLLGKPKKRKRGVLELESISRPISVPAIF